MNFSKKILIIDDDPTIRQSLGYFFADAGIPFLTADNGEQGLEFIKHNKIKVIIADIRLPGMDGVQFISKANALDPAVKFVIYTGSSHFTVTKKLQQTGISPDTVFYKPLPSLAPLADKIKTLYNS
ncbi:MAG TPA: response regulator [Spirochaetota bacterium]|nr:response regulator [Spirochaetota bacterium]